MKRKISVLVIAALVLSFSVCAFAEDVFILDKNGYIMEPAILNDAAAEVYAETGCIVSLCIGASDPDMNINEQAQRLFEEKYGQSDGIILLDCIDTKNCSIYFTPRLREILTQQDAAELFSVYDSQTDYDSSVSEYIGHAKILLKKASLNEESSVSLNVPEIPEERQLKRVVDEAGVIPQRELDELNRLADSVSEQYKCDVAVAFVGSSGGKDVQDHADDFYDYNGYGYGETDDGVLLLVAVNDRKYAISTYGFGVTAMNDRNLQNISDRFVAALSGNNWSGAAETFINGCGEYLYYARYRPEAYNGAPASRGIDPLSLIPVNIAVGFLLGLIPVALMKNRHKSVRKSYEASNYLKEGSFVLTYRNDRLISSNINRVKRAETTRSSGGSSIHISSSGRSHGGRSGSF